MIGYKILNQFKSLITDYFCNYSTKANKNFQKFLLDTLILYFVIQGKINFLQLGRYGKFSEQTYRNNFSKDFDWFDFNKKLASKNLPGTRKAIAIDPSFISKSGKQTPWIGYFWSGCASSIKRGLEILGIGLVDIDNHDCFTLQAIQTPDTITLDNEDGDIVTWYAKSICLIKDKLQELSSYIVADAYFAKSTFLNIISQGNFHLISRFR